jgi:hypothetical protein
MILSARSLWPGSQREQSASEYPAPFQHPGLRRTMTALPTGPLTLKDGQVDRHPFTSFPPSKNAIEMPGENNSRTRFGVLISNKNGFTTTHKRLGTARALDGFRRAGRWRTRIVIVEFDAILKGHVFSIQFTRE